MLNLAHDLGRAIREKKVASHVFVFRSTFVPGTVEDVLRPIIEQECGKRDGKDLYVCFQDGMAPYEAPDLAWAHDFGLMIQVSLFAFAVGGVF